MPLAGHTLVELVLSLAQSVLQYLSVALTFVSF